MKHKIYKSMCAIALIVMAITVLATIVVTYSGMIDTIEKFLINQTEFLKNILDDRDERVVLTDLLDTSERNVRITLIDSGDRVVFDNWEDAGDLQDISSRPEIEGALLDGEGKFAKNTETSGKQIIYYALRLKDGSVLRLGAKTDNLYGIIFACVPFLLAACLLVFLLATSVATSLTNRIVVPINTIDLEQPLKSPVYNELNPLLKRMETQRRQIDEQVLSLKQQHEIRREFSANVSHELKTPLTSISGYAELLMHGMVNEEDIAEFAGRIYNEAGRLILLVNDTIKLSHLDEGAEIPQREKVDLYELCCGVCERLRLVAEKNTIRLDCEGSPVFIQGVHSILEDMIYNLCDNAIKYNVKNGHVKIRVFKRRENVFLIVEDTGIGIEKDGRERIFERFYRVDKSHSGEIPGTGLGLSIVKHGTALHNAEVVVDSEPGSGTKITLIFKENIY